MIYSLVLQVCVGPIRHVVIGYDASRKLDDELRNENTTIHGSEAQKDASFLVRTQEKLKELSGENPLVFLLYIQRDSCFWGCIADDCSVIVSTTHSVRCSISMRGVAGSLQDFQIATLLQGRPML